MPSAAKEGKNAAGVTPDQMCIRDSPYYDKELLTHAAKESGMSKELFENYDEAPTNSLLYSLSMGAYSMGNLSAASFNLPLNHKVFLAQFDAIKKLADQSGCVIVGRCADYAAYRRYEPPE